MHRASTGQSTNCRFAVLALSDAFQGGTISLGDVMVSVTSNPAFVILTSTTPPGG